MTNKSDKKRGAPPPKPAGSAADDERPTVAPPFDVEAFAREAMPPSGNPHPDSDAPTHRPPPLPPAVPEFGREPITERVTLTNEVELEKARALSAVAGPPTRRSTSSALSIANARAPSSPSAPVEDDARDPMRHLSPSNIEAAVLGAIGESTTPEIMERTIDDPAAEMRERFLLGDYSGALEMADLILADSADNVEAAECGQNCRTVLENMYAARLGPVDRVPMVIVARAQMQWLSMDHRAGFILSLIDGSSSVEMILDMSGMPKLDAYRILHELVQQKIVSFR
ncbi:MAG: hypothetical protein M3O46_09860 [Myxococcota bacterium]|nr:hypothetical protein [Myxococcota bacterium]